MAFVVLALIFGVMVCYAAWLQRLRGHVAKAWLAVYETLLARADKVPLLVEIVRSNESRMGAIYESALSELVVARSRTQGMTFPSAEKVMNERAFEEVLHHVLDAVSEDGSLAKHGLLLRLLDEFSALESQLPSLLGVYHGTLRRYLIATFGLGGGKYCVFEFSS